MSFLQLAKRRRSIRVFRDEEVSAEYINRILEAGNLAPSAHNKQSWKFVVIKGNKKNCLADLINELSSLFPKKSRLLLRMAAKSVYTSSHVIAVFSTGELVSEVSEYGSDLKKEIEKFFIEMEIQSASAAVQNMLLEATELGLGTVWLGIVVLIAKQIECFLGIDGKLLAMFPVGYQSREYTPPKKKPLSEVVIELS
jgi:nitroreductase